MTPHPAPSPAAEHEHRATVIALPSSGARPLGPDATRRDRPVPRRSRRAGATLGRRAAAVARGPRRVVLRGRGALADAGMATAEYAIATLAAVGFAGLLLVVLRSGEVKNLLTGLIKRALSVSG